MHMRKLVKIYQFLLKVLVGNKILRSIKGINLLLLGNNWCTTFPTWILSTQFGQNPSIISQDIERKQNSDIIKGHNSVLNLQSLTCQPRSCQYQCIMQKLVKSINSFSRYWAETKFWHQSKAITLSSICKNWRVNLDLVNINALYISWSNPSTPSQDIDQKQNSDINERP